MITERIRNAIRRKYEIPDNVEFLISEDTEEDYSSLGCSCCSPTYSSYIETTISWELVPEGKKRKKSFTEYYTGTVWELIQELDMP
jgi:hypothetical protein